MLSESQELPIQRGSGGTAPDSAHPSTASIKVTEAVAKFPESRAVASHFVGALLRKKDYKGG